MMRLGQVLLKSLFFVIFLISLVESEGNSSEQLVLVAPVLAAPSRNSKASNVETAKDFPKLMLLTSPALVKEAQNRLLEDRPVNPQPIYVKKLQDQPQQNRHRKRRSTRIHLKKH
ncbi:hypothetical protein NE865_07795 [Phthorimaea operculella]|nr:hypothetical protein NE865_07795 [Phthorimaea operculella]